MKKLFLLGLVLLGICACSPSSNPINDDPTYDFSEKTFSASNKGGMIEIPVEYAGTYEVATADKFIEIIRSKANGKIVVFVQPNTSENERTGLISIRYTSNNSGGSTSVWIVQEPTSMNLSLVDVTKATSLYVAQSNTPTKSESIEQQLFKIAETGVVERVVFKNVDGDVIPANINYIRNLSTKYVYISLKLGEQIEDKHYVVRKTDGAVFAAKPPYIGKDTEVQTDHRQNIYYQSGYPFSIYKLYDYNNGVDIARLTKDYMGVSNYLVDPKGNVLLGYHNSLSGSSEDMCYTSSGEFARSAWSARSKAMFVLKKEPENFYELESDQIIKVKCTLPALTSEVLFDHLELNGIIGDFYDGSDFHNTRFILDDMTLYLGYFREDYSSSIPAILRIENERTYKIVALNRPEWPKYHKVLKVEGQHLYGYNNDEIFRVGILTGEVETLYANNEYSIYDFSLGANGVIIFSALELRKAQDVVCEIRNGQLKVLKTDDSQKIIQLERIN